MLLQSQLLEVVRLVIIVAGIIVIIRMAIQHDQWKRLNRLVDESEKESHQTDTEI